MYEKFIERGTDYQLEHGLLSVYETNCACRDIKFYFEDNVITIMVAGHKTVVSDNLKIEFFPGTLFIPERRVIQSVSIPNATLDNPTKCLVLKVNPNFLHEFYEEILFSEKDQSLLYPKNPSEPLQHFCSNNTRIIKTFVKLYQQRLQEDSRANQMIVTLMLKELLLRIFQTEGLHLLKNNFQEKIGDQKIQNCISYVRKNLHSKITVEEMAKISGLGTTTFFKKFKNATNLSPIDFLLKERIKLSKVLILKNRYALKEIAFKCGFNSYEYFCSRFKDLEKIRPSEFKKRRLEKI